MRRGAGSWCACIVFLLCGAAAAAAQAGTAGEDLRQATREVMLLITNLDFARADPLYARITRENPDAPHGHLLESYKLFWRFYLSGDEKTRTAEFLAAVQRLLDACGKRDPRWEQDRLLFLSCAHFFLAAVHEERGNNIQMLLEARAMNGAADELLKAQPDLVDARFVRGAVKAYFGSGPVPTDDLALVAEKGFYLAPIARWVLGRTLANRNKAYANALPIYQGLAAEYPGNTVFQFELSRTYQRMGKEPEALDAYRRTVASHRQDPPAAYILCRSRFAAGQLLEKAGRFEEALVEYGEALRMADTSDKATAWFVPWSHLQIGKCLERTGKRDLALSHLAMVRREDDRRAYEQAQRLVTQIQERTRGGGP